MTSLFTTPLWWATCFIIIFHLDLAVQTAKWRACQVPNCMPVMDDGYRTSVSLPHPLRRTLCWREKTSSDCLSRSSSLFVLPTSFSVILANLHVQISTTLNLRSEKGFHKNFLGFL
eukprot:TRINITY_DN849_c2_g1_i1.p1 TRINITY_DN849_c2_g1~~TRINITY_DN849_c2_g1_i1.p1  ORF type:complete len:116 (-),score=10.07 TRINITY_DN849_c2_g1_i1:745-1092(-)